MRKQLVAYRTSIDELIAASPAGTNWDAASQEHLVRISFFQHERLVHLLVTLAFALMELVSAITALITANMFAAILMLLFLVLLVPYVVHYYFLENETQKLYAQYDELVAHAERKPSE